MKNRKKLLIALAITIVTVNLILLSAILIPESVKQYTSTTINYSFYELIRQLSFVGRFLISTILFILKYKKLSLLSGIFALIYNPFIPIHMGTLVGKEYGRPVWIIIDILIILLPFIVYLFRYKMSKKNETIHNPKRLVKLLSNFTNDTPMKLTTHIWCIGGIKKEYSTYKVFMNKVKEQWEGMEKELKELSPNLHHKIYNFIFASKDENDWMINKDISIGWSTVEGFEEWCNEGNDPFAFKLKKSYLINGKELSKFGDIVNLFKQEIEIRKEYHMLENIFMDIEESLDEKYSIEDSKLHGKNFYTDVETFKYALNKIFSEIQKRDFYKILVEATDTTGEYIDITITQVGSKAQSTVNKMLHEINDGDFEDIKRNLTNLCDWSIESHFEDGNYRINFLRADANIPEIEVLNTKPKGFTHKLRFYR
jgi:hypothetical protein